MNDFPVQRPFELSARPEAQNWLIDKLWCHQAVGILGGEPKCCKSFLALDLAVAVASGAACLRRFQPQQTGPVLLFAAEDALEQVRRLEGIALAAHVCFESLDIHVITAPKMRLDLAEDQQRLEQTVVSLRPKLLVLDPFVRIHRIDENVAADVAPLLGFLRELQRCHSAVLLVHHARKGAAHLRAGQALRGSSEIHAWGDSNLYLRRRGDRLSLTVEHRAASSIDDLTIELKSSGQALALHVVENLPQERPATFSPSPTPAAQRVEHTLAASDEPIPLQQLRKACRIKTATLCAELASLMASGRVLKSPKGYQFAQS